MDNHEYLEEAAPVLTLIANRLASDPEWSLALLEQLIPRIMLPRYRQKRDAATQHAEAIEYGMMTLALSPNSATDAILLAHSLTHAKRLAEARVWSSYAIALKPEEPEFLRLRASILEQQGLLVEAEADLKTAIRLQPDNEGLALHLSKVADTQTQRLRQERDGATDLSHAIAKGLEVVARQEDSHSDAIALAHKLTQAKRLTEALEWANRAISLKPEEPEFLRLRASILEQQGLLAEAETDLKTAVRLQPDNEGLALHLSKVADTLTQRLRQERDGATDLSHAIAKGLEVVARQENAHSDMIALAHKLTEARRLTEALEWATRAIALKPDDARYYCLCSSLQEQLGKIWSAKQTIQQGLHMASQPDLLLADKARIYRKYILKRLGLSFLVHELRAER